MRTKFEFRKDAYSAKKGEFKKILKRYDLAWKRGSTPYSGSWISGGEKLYAEWDAEKNTGLFVYEGENADLFEELKSFVDSIEGKMTEGYVPTKDEIRAMVERGLRYVTHEGRMPEMMRKRGAPESYIKAAVEDWERIKKSVEREVKKEFN
ncbi:hypothetical protein KKA69_04670 [Patescibacteria group bacterium]|nr:hypothetical protein [Patescibacteria group bacterium]